MKRRVVITGMGALSPIGNSVEKVWQAIENNECGIDAITHFDASDFKVKVAAEVKDLDMEIYFSKRDLKFNDRFIQFARIASKQAMLDSKIDTEKIDVHRMGVCIASGIGGIQSIENSHSQLIERGTSRVSPFFIPMSLINLASGNVAIDTGAKGQCWSVVTACAAAANAIGESFHKIRDGYQDIMITGGAEASITPLAMAGFQSMRALYTGNDIERASIPFDAKRSGFVMGEGAGILVLEEYQHAKKRGAKIYGEIVGYGMSCDSHHITAPLEDGSGAASAMTLAMQDAGINRDQIDYINAHGTSTPLNDKAETIAVKKAFERYATCIPISSTKSNTGHLLGASGAIEAIICLQALQHNLIPATIHYQEKDPDCDLDVVVNTNRNADLNYVMSNSLGFGGHNASLVFKKVNS